MIRPHRLRYLHPLAKISSLGDGHVVDEVLAFGVTIVLLAFLVFDAFKLVRVGVWDVVVVEFFMLVSSRYFGDDVAIFFLFADLRRVI